MRKIYTLIVLIFASLLSLPAISQVIIGSDNAGNYSSWNKDNPGNHGNGFGDWVLTNENQGGHFIGPVSNGFGNINSENKSFGMYGNPENGNNYANASREIIEWKNGYSFEIDLAIAERNSGNKGIDFFDNSGGPAIYTFYANSDQYKVDSLGNHKDLGWDFNGESIFHLRVIQYGNNLHVTLTRDSDIHTVIIPDKKLKSFHLFVGETSTGDNNNLYFNNLVLKRHASVLFDDFNRGDNNEVGVPSSNPGGENIAWTEYESVPNSDHIQILNNELRMSATTANEREFVSYDMSDLYPVAFDEATDALRWALNWHQNRGALSGFISNNFGAAFIIGCSNSDFINDNAFGYAVIHGGSGDGKNNTLRLIKFKNGLTNEANFTEITHLPLTGNYKKYLSIQVEYISEGNEWRLYLKEEENSFSPPIEEIINWDSGIDFEYTSSDLPYSGFLWKHNIAIGDVFTVDDFYVPSSSVPTDNEYVWRSDVGSGNYSDPNNWIPERTHPRKRDRLVFDGGGKYVVTDIPDNTIGQLIIRNTSNTGRTQVFLKNSKHDPDTTSAISLSGGTGLDFLVDTNSTLNIDTRGNGNSNGMVINMLANTTGEIRDSVIFNNTSNALEKNKNGKDHRIFVADENGLHVRSGGVVYTKFLNGNPFGKDNNENQNVIIFESGSKYIHRQGANPFGQSHPKSKVKFEPGSWYEYTANGNPAVTGRTYANFKYNPPGNPSLKNLTGGSAYSIDTLVVLNGGLNFQLYTTGTIKGDIEVASGATLNFTPSGGSNKATIVLNSDVPQNIYGGGTLKFGDGATIKIQNEEKVSIQKNVTIETGGKAIVEADGVIEFVNESYFGGGGETKIEDNASIYIGSSNGITSSGTSGNVRTSTRDYSDKAAYIYNGTVNQVTGSGLPLSLIDNGRIEIDNPGNIVTLTQVPSPPYHTTPKLTLTNGVFKLGTGIIRISKNGQIIATNGNFAAGTDGGMVEFLANATVSATGNLDFWDVRLLKEYGESTGVNFGSEGNPTIHNYLTINKGQWIDDKAPFYADGSTLFYNSGDNYVAGAEWYADTTSGRGVPYNVLIGMNDKGTNLSFAGANRYLRNNLNIGGNSGSVISSFTLHNNDNSYLEIGGNFIVNSKGSFNPNGARVIFSGSGDQTITSHATGNEVNFNYLTINKSGGDLILDDNPGTTVNVVANTNEVLVLTKGDIDLNGQTFKLGGNGGELKLEGSTGSSRSIKSNKAANFIFTGEKTVVSPSLELIFEDSVTVAITTSQSEPIGVDFGAGNPTRIEGTLRIDQNGFANVNAPFYGPQGILQYNINGPYKRRVEWHGKEGDPGFPNHVIVGGNTTLAAGGEGGEMVNEEFGARLDVIIEPGSSLYMDYDQHHMKVPLKVGRDLIIHGNLSASGAPGGDIHVAGNWIREVGGVFNPKERQVLFNGKTAQTITAPGTGETFDYLGFDSTGTKTLLSNIIVNKKLEIFGHSGAFKPGANVITLNGHWENSAGEEGFEHGTSTVVFKGDGEQKVKTSAAKENFYNVEIDNSSAKTEGVQLDSTDINIHGLLTLTEGLIHPDTNLVHFQNGSSTSEGNDVSYINGKARKTGFNSNDVINGFIFPVGYLKDTIDVFQPSGIIPESTSTTASFTVDYVHENYFPDTWVPNIPPPMGAGLATVSGCDYWNIERTVGGVDAKVRLYWSEACFDISEPNSLVVAKVEDGQWVNMGQSAVSPADFEDPYYRSGWVESSNVNNFSPFAIASSNPINVLPIELISFNAFAKGDKVETTWVTSTEKNNAYFTVEKSLDARHFVEVGRVEGAGNSTSQNSYALTDNRPYSGISYYRLKQTDFDGSHTYSEIRSVRIDRDSKFELVKIYRSDLGLNLAYRSEAEVLGVEIFDLVGKKIYHSQINNNNGFSTIHPNFARGIYLLRLSNGFEAVTEKFFW